MNKDQFKELFLKLTEYTIPYKKESTLVPLLPPGYRKDDTGNYYYQIGNSETLFTCHLDTFSKMYKKVTHVIDEKDPYIIRTDGKTILGGDNKLGCAILIGMIEASIPGTYYFFIGEEVGCQGSRGALGKNPEYFKKFKRSIAFDRRRYGSIVVRQRGMNCCSKEFAKKIAQEFDIRGVKWDELSGFGYFTDTAVFMDTIPECTNLSAGGFEEHHNTEYADLNYAYQVYKIALEVDWEKLPTVRKPMQERFYEEKPKFAKNYKRFKQNNSYNKNYSEIKRLMTRYKISDTRNIFRNGERHLTLSKWLQDFDVNIDLIEDRILLNNHEVSLQVLKKYIIENFKNDE